MSIRATAVLHAALFFVLVVWQCATGYGADGVKSDDGTKRTRIAVWDTILPSAVPYSPETVSAKSGWTQMAAQATAASFLGDAAMSNGRILAIARKEGSALEVYSAQLERPILRLRLLLLTATGEPVSRLERARLIENTRSAACLELVGKTTGGASLAAKFQLKRGEPLIQTEPGAGAGRLRIECPSRFVILPDFFADDILIDAAKIPGSTLEAPTDNFVLHLSGDEDVVGMSAFENREQDVQMVLAGEGEKRTVTGSDIGFEGKKIWTAVLTGPQIWHQRQVAADDAGEILPLAWKMPFPAQWRVDFTRKDGLTDSWEMLLQSKKNAEYVKTSWLGGREETLKLNRERWNTFLNTFPYPCWTDHEQEGYIQPLRKEGFQFQGPAVLYPINRVKQTPLDVYTVVDVMRNTLGTGPCEHILDIEGQKTDYKGEPTCGVEGDLEEIYGARQQKQKRAEVEKLLDKALAFVTHIRSRITRYIDFAHDMREYLAAQKKAHPELSEPIAELDKIVARIDTRVAPEAKKIPRPDHVARLNEDFRKNILDYDGPDALERCKKYGKALTDIGGDQDELVGECRWVVRTLRQRAGVLVAVDPRLAAIAAEIRAKTQQALRNPAGYEWSRH